MKKDARVAACERGSSASSAPPPPLQVPTARHSKARHCFVRSSHNPRTHTPSQPWRADHPLTRFSEDPQHTRAREREDRERHPHPISRRSLFKRKPPPMPPREEEYPYEEEEEDDYEEDDYEEEDDEDEIDAGADAKQKGGRRRRRGEERAAVTIKDADRIDARSRASLSQADEDARARPRASTVAHGSIADREDAEMRGAAALSPHSPSSCRTRARRCLAPRPRDPDGRRREGPAAPPSALARARVSIPSSPATTAPNTPPSVRERRRRPLNAPAHTLAAPQPPPITNQQATPAPPTTTTSCSRTTRRWTTSTRRTMT